MLKRNLLPLFLLAGVCSLSAQGLPSVQEVYAIFEAKCISCHSHATPAGGLDLEGTGNTQLGKAVNVAQKLYNINPSNAHAQSNGYKRVYPGRPDRSFLFKKINSGFEPSISALHQDEGNAMPDYPGTPLTEVEKEIIRQWILYGAKNSGTQFNKALIEDFYAGNGEKSFPDGPPPAPAPSEGFQIKMGPFYLAPDGEIEYFQKYELQLPANLEVNKLQFALSSYSHHFIVYNFGSPAGANAIPHGLRLNANHSDIGLVAAVQEATQLDLPPGTAFKWASNMVLDLNSHYINYSLTKVYQCEVYVNVYTQPQGTADQEMFAALLANTDIYIPNNGNSVSFSQAEFSPGTDTIHVWGLMGHTHKYGTGYKVWKRQPNGTKGALLYDASCPLGTPDCPAPYFDYQHIPIKYWEPLLPIDWDYGIIHEASWENEGPTPVSFGPTSDDEMMVLIAFYTLQPVLTDTEEPQDLSGAPGNIRFAPNPTDGFSRVSLPESIHHIREMRVFDISGRLVWQRQDISGNTVEADWSTLQPGMYFMQADGFNGKFVVER